MARRATDDGAPQQVVARQLDAAQHRQRFAASSAL